MTSTGTTRTASAVLEALGQPDNVAWERLEPGHSDAVVDVAAAPPLFPRVDAPAAA